MKKPAIANAINMIGIPSPRPIFAPADKPVFDGVGVGLAVTVTSAGLLAVELVVFPDVVAAAANFAMSELCHMIGIPSPYMFQVASVTVVVRKVEGTTHSLSPFKVGKRYVTVDVFDVNDEWHEWPSPS